jgi:hypothetical protein
MEYGGSPGLLAERLERSSRDVHHLDVRSLALVYGVREAITSGDQQDVKRALAAHRRFASVSSRPADHWAQEAMWSTVLQFSGDEGALRRAEGARVYGSKYECGDVDLAFGLFLTASTAYGQEVPTHLAEFAAEQSRWTRRFTRSRLSPSEEQATDLGQAVIEVHREIPAVHSLSRIAWTAELAWRAGDSSVVPSLLTALDLCSHQGSFIVLGHLPVTSAGPVARVRAILLAMAGRFREADAHFVEAIRQCEKLGAHWWEQRVIRDQETAGLLARRPLETQ